MSSSSPPLLRDLLLKNAAAALPQRGLRLLLPRSTRSRWWAALRPLLFALRWSTQQLAAPEEEQGEQQLEVVVRVARALHCIAALHYSAPLPVFGPRAGALHRSTRTHC